MRRLGVVLATAAAVVLGWAGAAHAAYEAPRAVKLDVLGEWAHPDDDTSIIGPCGVWHHRYGVRCGIIMVTRGEGGGNATGTEIGPELGLRRENEDRIAHYRSGTVDIFNLDRVDFFYNTSAPLTQFFWDEEETLRRVTRVIRMTQPEIYIGYTPTLRAGHGNHQQAGRLIWEGVPAAADPRRFPEQLRGPHALRTWQVKKVFSGGSTAGTGGTTTAPDCTTGFAPEETNVDTVVGVWTGYDSPYKWPAGNLQGQPPGSPKSWAQVAAEGASAYPTQSRTMYKDVAPAGCPRFGMTWAFVPFQPNTSPLAGRDDAILYGAGVRDPGGLPLGTLLYLTFDRFFNVAGTPFQATVHLRAPARRRLRAGTAALAVPSGWTVDGPKRFTASRNGREVTATFTVTPAAGAAKQSFRIAARVAAGRRTGYTDNAVRIVAAAEGRFQRWGKWREYDEWLARTAPQAYRLGRSPALQTTGVGETLTVPVVVHNWSGTSQTGTVSLGLPPEISADAASKPYGPLAPGADTTVTFTLTNSYTNATLPPNPSNVTIPITTTSSAPSGSDSEDLTLGIVPRTTIPAASTAPLVDGVEDAAYTGEALDIGRKWEGQTDCVPPGVDCGSSGAPGTPGSTYARVTRAGDDLYFFIHVRDDFQSYAATPEECVAHWLADSVEILIDPRGDAAQRLRDTANTFKLGVFPYTNDPANRNGNGVNGPCWSRDADNRQGYSTGPLALSPPNAPGVQVASTASWVGTNDTGTSHAYAGGGYDLEVKIPLADLPAAVDPDHMGLNITPYDNDDNTAGTGSTVLRHIDMSTRLAWSTFGSVQSDPHRWGHAVLAGYTPPADRPTTAPDPQVQYPALNGADSPQTIYQSAHDGVPISGRPPAPARDSIRRARARLTADGVRVRLRASGPGTARVFLWTGDPHAIPVWTTSCSPAADPWPDWSMTPCAEADGATPPWSPDMSGHVLAKRTLQLERGRERITIPLDAAQRARLAADGRVLISFETAAGETQAVDVRTAWQAKG